MVAAAYQPGARDLSASDVPYVYAYYDEKNKKFVSPLDISPTLNAGSYTLEAALHAFNIRKSDQASFKNLRTRFSLGSTRRPP